MNALVTQEAAALVRLGPLTFSHRRIIRVQLELTEQASHGVGMHAEQPGSTPFVAASNAQCLLDRFVA